MELRKQEFAILKSIGMTSSEFNKMIRLESIFMCIKSLIYGISIGLLLSYLIYYALGFRNGIKFELPDGNGFSLYENRIKDLNIPTIFLTARDEEDDIVKGLELGVDEYITKPFSTKELLVRINRIIMRNKKNTIIEIDDIKYDYDKMEVYKNNVKVDLSSLEIKLLNLLFTNLNKVVTRSSILDKIWEWTGNDIDGHTITVYFKRIREKLNTNIIITVKGIGYRIDYEK